MMKVRGTRDVAKRQAYVRKYRQHIRDVCDDREELARIQRLCIVNKNHCGFFLDAADSNKFGIPTTTSTAKLLSQLYVAHKAKSHVCADVRRAQNAAFFQDAPGCADWKQFDMHHPD